MLGKRNLIRIIRIRLIAINRLRSVRILRRPIPTASRPRTRRRRRLAHAIPAHAADRAALVSRHGAGGLEPIELGGRVHLWGLGGGARGVGAEAAGHAAEVAVGDAAGGAGGGFLFVEGEGVDVGAVGGGRLAAVVEYPDDLWDVY